MTASTLLQSCFAAAPSGWSAWFKDAQLPPWLAPVLASAGIVIGLWIIVMQWRLDHRRSARGPASAAPHQPRAEKPLSSSAATASLNLGPAAAHPLATVMTDAEELIERIAAQAETHAARLERLIADASLAERRLTEATARASLAAEQARVAADQASGRPPATATSGNSGRPMPVIEAKPAAPRTPLELRADPAADPHEQVFELADQGLPALSIAKMLGQPIGEVELILSLRRL